MRPPGGHVLSQLKKNTAPCRFHQASFDSIVDAGVTGLWLARKPGAESQTIRGDTTLRFMIVVRATKDSEAGKFPQEKEKMFAAMMTYHEEMEKAGALLDASGLQPSSRGWRVKYTGAKRTVTDGPFIETKELIAGYTIIQVKSREEALEWTKRFPNPVGEGAEAEIEVRQLYELEDLGPSDAIERFRNIEARKKPQLASSSDEADIRSLIERWAKAVREENRAAIRTDHDPAILMFDVPPPFLSRGVDAYMATWETFFSSVEKPVAFAFHDVQVTCGQDVGFATAIGRCVNIDANGKRKPLEFRLTMGLCKTEGRWRVMHEHHSLPATEESRRTAMGGGIDMHSGKKSDTLQHATIRLQHSYPAPPERVFSEFADPVARARWSAPSKDALIYDETDFRLGGKDVFRCGPKGDPKFRGETRYLNVVTNARVVSSETLDVEGQRLAVALTTLDFEPTEEGTNLTVTIQIVSFVGPDMIHGYESGNKSALKNLSVHLSGMPSL
jgi:ketosteroid isomerase-like protein/uncharacterized protein YndB with AHSA1/START domain